VEGLEVFLRATGTSASPYVMKWSSFEPRGDCAKPLRGF
jgi:hypothetical protein